MNRRWNSAGLLVGLLCTMLPASASAHLVSTRFGELYGGILHPLTTLAHAVPWLGLGLLAGLQTPRVARLSPWLMPAAACVGALLGASLPELEIVTYANLLSFVVLGGLVALAVNLPRAAFVTLSLVFGITHGYGNAIRGLTGNDRILYALGVMLAAYALLTLVAAAAQWLHERASWGAIALRAAGSWIVAIGLVFGGFTLLAAR